MYNDQATPPPNLFGQIHTDHEGVNCFSNASKGFLYIILPVDKTNSSSLLSNYIYIKERLPYIKQYMKVNFKFIIKKHKLCKCI